MIKKVAILTNGGDAPGLNAVTRAIVKCAKKDNVEVYGYIDGYKGILENEYIRLDDKDTSELISVGGTILGSSNDINLFNMPFQDKKGNISFKDTSDVCAQNIKNAGFDVVFALGGDGTLKSAYDFSKKGIPFIGIPKTIDNDVPCTDMTFGFQTAVQTVTDAVDKLVTTSKAHKRIMVVEVMGRYSGWIALYSAIASGADALLLPEVPFDLQKVADNILQKKKEGKKYAIVIVSEGAYPKGGHLFGKKNDKGKGLDTLSLGGVGEYVAQELEKLTGKKARAVTLGYLQRGGTPTAFDRILSSKYGQYAYKLAKEGKTNSVVILKDGKFESTTLDQIVGKNTKAGSVSGSSNKDTNLKVVKKDNELLKLAQDLDICVGM